MSTSSGGSLAHGDGFLLGLILSPELIPNHQCEMLFFASLIELASTDQPASGLLQVTALAFMT